MQKLPIMAMKETELRALGTEAPEPNFKGEL